MEGIPSQIQTKQSIGANDRIQGLQRRDRHKEPKLVPSAHRLLLPPDQMEIVTLAENLLKQALGDETLATLSKDDNVRKITTSTIRHFMMLESIDNLFQKHLSLLSRMNKTKASQNKRRSDDTCQDLRCESKASQEACDKIEGTVNNGDNHLLSHSINIDKQHDNVFIVSANTSFSDDPVSKMFNILNSSRDTVSRRSDKDVSNSVMGDPSVRKCALFRSLKSSSNLCIFSSTDYVVSEDNTAYAKMIKHSRTHKIFNNSIAGEKRLRTVYVVLVTCFIAYEWCRSEWR